MLRLRPYSSIHQRSSCMTANKQWLGACSCQIAMLGLQSSSSSSSSPCRRWESLRTLLGCPPRRSPGLPWERWVCGGSGVTSSQEACLAIVVSLLAPLKNSNAQQRAERPAGVQYAPGLCSTERTHWLLAHLCAGGFQGSTRQASSGTTQSASWCGVGHTRGLGTLVTMHTINLLGQHKSVVVVMMTYNSHMCAGHVSLQVAEHDDVRPQRCYSWWIYLACLHKGWVCAIRCCPRLAAD